MTENNRLKINLGLSEMLKSGVIMDVVTPDQAKIAEDSGAVAVMALERVPADIRKDGSVARMSDPKIIKEIIKSVSIPVMAKVRIGHTIEAKILEEIGVDFIDESEVLTPADDNHIYKKDFNVPFVCGCNNLAEALRRISEGAALVRTKGEAGTGDIIQAVRQMRSIKKEINIIKVSSYQEIISISKNLKVSSDALSYVKEHGSLPVPNFSAGGIATPADAALMMSLGAESVFVGSGIFKSENPKKRAEAIVSAVTHYNNPEILLKISEDIGFPMTGINCDNLLESEKFSTR